MPDNGCVATTQAVKCSRKEKGLAGWQCERLWPSNGQTDRTEQTVGLAALALCLCPWCVAQGGQTRQASKPS